MSIKWFSHSPLLTHFTGQIISKLKSQKFSSKDFPAYCCIPAWSPCRWITVNYWLWFLQWDTWITRNWLSVDSACILIGIKSWTTLFRSWLFPLMRGTLTIAALIFTSLPGRSSFTFASFQMALEVESFLSMTMSQTRTVAGLPFADFAVGLSRKPVSYTHLTLPTNREV